MGPTVPARGIPRDGAAHLVGAPRSPTDIPGICRWGGPVRLRQANGPDVGLDATNDVAGVARWQHECGYLDRHVISRHDQAVGGVTGADGFRHVLPQAHEAPTNQRQVLRCRRFGIFAEAGLAPIGFPCLKA